MSFIGLLRTLEQITRPPRLGHDLDVEDGADQLTEREAQTRVEQRLGLDEQDAEWTSPSGIVWSFDRGGWQWRYADAQLPSWRSEGDKLSEWACENYGPFSEVLAAREAQTECLVPEDFNAVCGCAACVAEERAAEDELSEPAECECWPVEKPWTYYGIVEPGGAMEFNPDCPVHGRADTLNPTEPGSRWCACGSQTCGVCREAVPQLPLSDSELSAVRGALINLQTSASNHTRTGAEPAPSPTIVQSAPPPTVDGEGPASVRDIQPSPEAGRPTSELLLDGANAIECWIEHRRTPSLKARVLWRSTVAELRARAATFKAIEE